MKFGAKSRTCLIVCCLLLAFASLAAAAPYKIWEERQFGSGSGNPYYFGGVFDGKAWGGNFYHGAQQWADEQTWGSAPTAAGNNFAYPLTFAAKLTAVAASTDFLPVAAYTDGGGFAKSAFPLGGYIYMSDAWTTGLGGGWISRVPTWGYTGTPEKVSWPAGSSTAAPGSALTGDSPDGACTDGTDIYTVCASGSSNGVKNIYGWTINHATKTLTQKWMTTMPARCRMVSYDAASGKLYTANGSNGDIYEISPATGSYTKIAAAANTGAGLYQTVRYGNKIFSVSLGDDSLHTFTLSGGTWSETSVDVILTGGLMNDANISRDCYGIAVTGDGVNAKYAWISSVTGVVSFWDLTPWAGAPAHFGDGMKNGYPVYVDEAVVTAVASDAFWVENKKRTIAARVPWAGTMPVPNSTVTIKAPAMTKSDSGERTINATEVTQTGQYSVAPLFTTNKNLGLATGGAGLANDGMLVKVSGKITGYDPNGWFIYIDDGSGVANDTPNADVPVACKGTKIMKADNTTLWGVPELSTYFYNPYPAHATVVGVVRLEKLTNGTIVRRIDARSDADVVVTAL